MAARLAELRGSHFLIVDEGPGLSGSSFCGTAALLGELGVPDERIALLPSHLPDPAGFVSDGARRNWARYRKVAPLIGQDDSGPGALAPRRRDLSGGAWRDLLDVPRSAWPAVQPQHERVKYLDIEAQERPILRKFAGLGRYGRRTFERAERLARAGFTPEVYGLERGFIAHAYVEGQPVLDRSADAGLVAAATTYLRHLAVSHQVDGPAEWAPLLEMVSVNVEEALGPEWLGRIVGLERMVDVMGDVPAVAIDGRMLPHEWLATPDRGHVKTDATDHHADHFYPGATDIAWDVAAFGVEFGLSGGAVEAMAKEIGGRRIVGRLKFHEVAYLAFRVGYTSMAASALAGSEDGARMTRQRGWYEERLRRELRAL